MMTVTTGKRSPHGARILQKNSGPIGVAAVRPPQRSPTAPSYRNRTETAPNGWGLGLRDPDPGFWSPIEEAKGVESPPLSRSL
jgi:hypothetical protein